jgi:hypothetical protein
MPSEFVGREPELAAVDAFLDAPATNASALQIEGPGGIGKTTLWLAGVERAREHGALVLVARPASEEAGLGFAGLAGLLDGIALDRLPGPMRAALEVALLLRESEPGGHPRAVSSAVLAWLRGLASRSQTLVAIDDLPWLDAASASALAFSARRLFGYDVRSLCTARSADAEDSALARVLDPRRIALEPLSGDAIGRLVHDRLGARLPRPALRRVCEVSDGNPELASRLAGGSIDQSEG